MTLEKQIKMKTKCGIKTSWTFQFLFYFCFILFCKGAVASPTWTDHSLIFNDFNVVLDTAGHRAFIALGEGFREPTSYNVVINYQVLEASYHFRIDDAVIADEGRYTLSNIQYGSELLLKRYKGNRYIDQYTLIFTGLPIIKIAADSIVDEPKSPGTFALYSSAENQNTEVFNIGIEYRGASSQVYPKKSFSLEIGTEDDWETGMNTRFLNMRKDDDWVMDAAFRDTTFVRHQVGHDLFLAMRSFAHKNGSGDKKGQAAPRGRLSEVILNNRYHGLYMLMEKVDRKLVKLSKIDVPEDSEGEKLWQQVDFTIPDNGSVMYKAVNHAGDFYSRPNLHQGYEQKYPKGTNAQRWQPIDDLVSFVANSSRAEFITKIGDKVDVDNIVDYWLLILTIQGKDNNSKNYYIARSKTEKFFLIPWDMDQSFGMHWTGRREASTDWYPIKQNNLIRRLSKHTETGFNNKLQARWKQLRAGVLSESALINRFKKYLDLQRINNADKRNFSRWPKSGGSGAGDNELNTIAYIEAWVNKRMAFLDKKIDSLTVLKDDSFLAAILLLLFK